MMPRKHAVDLAEEMAKRHFDIQAQLIFEMTNHSKTSVTPFAKKWEDVPEQDRLQSIEVFRRLLADQEILQMLRNRAAL